MRIRKLTEKDRHQVDELIAVIERTLPDEKFWLPIDSECREHFFEDDWSEFYGLFSKDKLIGVTALFYRFEDYLGVPSGKEAEVGRCMVHPDYRGNNFLVKLNKHLIKEAKTKGIKKLVATVHPRNFPSIFSLEKVGFRKVRTIIIDSKYTRNTYVMQI